MKKFLGKLFLFFIFGIVVTKSIHFIQALQFDSLIKKILIIGLKKSSIIFFIWLLKEPYLLVKKWVKKFLDNEENNEVKIDVD